MNKDKWIIFVQNKYLVMIWQETYVDDYNNQLFIIDETNLN